MDTRISTTAEAAREQARTTDGRFGAQPAAEATPDIAEFPQWTTRLDLTPPERRPASLAWASSLKSGVAVPGSPAVFDTDSFYDRSERHSEVTAEVYVPAHREGDQVTTPAPSGNGTLTWDVDENDRLTLVHASADAESDPSDTAWTEFVGTVDEVAGVPAPTWSYDDGFDQAELEGVQLVRDEKGNPLMAKSRAFWFELG